MIPNYILLQCQYNNCHYNDIHYYYCHNIPGNSYNYDPRWRTAYPALP